MKKRFYPITLILVVLFCGTYVEASLESEMSTLAKDLVNNIPDHKINSFDKRITIFPFKDTRTNQITEAGENVAESLMTRINSEWPGKIVGSWELDVHEKKTIKARGEFNLDLAANFAQRKRNADTFVFGSLSNQGNDVCNISAHIYRAASDHDLLSSAEATISCIEIGAGQTVQENTVAYQPKEQKPVVTKPEVVKEEPVQVINSSSYILNLDKYNFGDVPDPSLGSSLIIENCNGVKGLTAKDKKTAGSVKINNLNLVDSFKVIITCSFFRSNKVNTIRIKSLETEEIVIQFQGPWIMFGGKKVSITSCGWLGNGTNDIRIDVNNNEAKLFINDNPFGSKKIGSYKSFSTITVDGIKRNKRKKDYVTNLVAKNNN